MSIVGSMRPKQSISMPQHTEGNLRFVAVFREPGRFLQINGQEIASTQQFTKWPLIKWHPENRDRGWVLKRNSHYPVFMTVGSD